LSDASRWRREPFRLFFPLGVVLGALGIGHWLLYVTGASDGYSCLAHGLAQFEGFLPALALGFLLTAVPRRTRSPPPSGWLLAGAGAGLTIATLTVLGGHEALGQAAFIAVVVAWLAFAVRCLSSRTASRRPPASFVLLPIGLSFGLAGAASILAALLRGGPVWALGLGRLLVTQALFSCLVVGVGALIVPLMAGAQPPVDFDALPDARWRVAGWALLGAGILATVIGEEAGWARLAPIVRGGLVAWGIGWAASQRLLAGPGLNRRLMWLALRLTPLGMVLGGILPDYRVPALHVTFIGGFGLMAFAVASHVSYGHLGLEAQRDGAPPAVVLIGSGLVLALLARVTADWSDSYFAHVGAAALSWLVGTMAWLALLGPLLLAPDRRDAPPR
jgi:uncharacterized protein involved in response to NO